MKKIIAWVMLGVMASAFVAGCTPKDEEVAAPGGAATDGAPKGGGKMNANDETADQ